MLVQADALAHDVADMLRLAAEPVTAGELVIEQIRRAARRCNLTFSRCKKLWYTECRVSAVDFVKVTQTVAHANDALTAYQNAKAVLIRQRLDDARGRA